MSSQSEIRNPKLAIPLVPFVKLADPRAYVACSWDLVADADGRFHWIEFFKRHIRTIVKLGTEAATARNESLDDVNLRGSRLLAEFDAFFDDVARRPQDFAPLTILRMDIWRDDLLRKHGFVDAFVDLKNRENLIASGLVAEVCDGIDALTGVDQVRAVIEGVFAGNIFDMGAEATAKAFLKESPNFFTTRSTLSRRPWLIDDFDALADRFLNGKVHRHAIFFIDNAGSDFMLGAVPMIRWLAMRGTPVTIAANERPTLNDMTIHDVRDWWPTVLKVTPHLDGLPITHVSTGTGEPLIDLAGVSKELNDASADADLVVIEGMGRGVESNLDARFSCDAVNLAMIKDTMVAKRHAGKVFDCVCRFR